MMPRCNSIITIYMCGISHMYKAAGAIFKLRCVMITFLLLSPKKEGRFISLELFLSGPGGSEAVCIEMSHASYGCLCLPLVNSAPLSLLSLPSPTSQHSLCSSFLPQLNSALSKGPNKLLQAEMEVNGYHQCYITQNKGIPSLTKLSLQLSNRKSLLWHFKHGSRDSCLANGYPEAIHIPAW